MDLARLYAACITRAWLRSRKLYLSLKKYYDFFCLFHHLFGPTNTINSTNWLDWPLLIRKPTIKSGSAAKNAGLMINFRWDALRPSCGSVFWTPYQRNHSKDETGLTLLPLPIMCPRDQAPNGIRGTTQLSVTQMRFPVLLYSLSALMEWLLSKQNAWSEWTRGFRKLFLSLIWLHPKLLWSDDKKTPLLFLAPLPLAFPSPWLQIRMVLAHRLPIPIIRWESCNSRPH